MSQIRDITPIKGGMNQDQARAAAKDFLCNTLRPENMINGSDVCSVVDQQMGIRSYKLITLNDGSSWVQGDKGIQRLVGAEYVKQKLEGLELNMQWKVAETKYLFQNSSAEYVTCKITTSSTLKGLLVIESDDFITFSKYAGDKKLLQLSPFSDSEKFLALHQDKVKITSVTGFSDFTENANLREQKDSSIVIIDTEYMSFSTPKTEPSELIESALIGLEFTFPLSEILG